MSVKTREEILESIKTRMGDKTDDDTIAFLEDITDTFSDLETRANGDGTDWKSKYEENDAEWRRKYTDRFYSSEDNPEGKNVPPDEESAPKKFEDLFTTGS